MATTRAPGITIADNGNYFIGLWCKFRARLRLADVARSDRHAFSTAFQISGAVRPLPRRRPSAN